MGRKRSGGEHSFRDSAFLVIRTLLVLAIVLNVVTTFAGSGTNRFHETPTSKAKNIELVFYSVITLLLTLLPDFIEKRKHMDIPDILEIVVVAFIYAAIFLSAQFSLYQRFFWWDDLLHTLSGMIIGFIGFIVLYVVNRKFSMDLSPLLVALFSCTFAITVGVVWEILEFASDVLFGTAHQKWNLPDTEILIGKPYQGSGLRDTMSDLIVDGVGALITSVVCYFLYRNEKKPTLEAMEKMYDANA